jgi:putative tricarboxylic transport membrane protein
MSEQLTDASADKITGAAGMLAGAAYGYTALNIEDSLLADAVGAGGVPLAVSATLFLAALILSLRAWFKSPVQTPVQTPVQSADPAVQSDAAQGGSAHPHLMAGALLLLLALYVWVLPFLGYLLSIGLLVASCAWLGGARQKRSLMLAALLAGPALWLIFDWALAIGLPMGVWPSLVK